MRLNRRLVLLTGALALVTASAAGFIGEKYSRAGHGSAAAATLGMNAVLAAFADPASIFAERSPGSRGGGALLQTKPGRAPLKPEGPHERVLPLVRERPPVSDLAEESPLLPPAPFASSELARYAPEGASTDALPGAGSAFPSSILGAPTGTDSPPAQSPAPPTPPGVPEPATWLTMIIGFFAIGAALRHPGARRPVRKDRPSLDA
jgi:hypothetical protein